MFDVLKLLIESPGSLAVVVVFGGALFFYCGVTYSSISYMRSAMVTKKDLTIALGEFNKSMTSEFVTKDDLRSALADFRDKLSEQFVTDKACTAKHNLLTVPMSEHIDLQARLIVVEEKVKDLRNSLE